MKRYKDYYPVFLDYWHQRTGGSQSKLTEARKNGKRAFLKAFWYVLKYDAKLKGWRKAMHDAFIGTRVL